LFYEKHLSVIRAHFIMPYYIIECLKLKPVYIIMNVNTLVVITVSLIIHGCFNCKFKS